MLQFLADENLNEVILRGLRRRLLAPEIFTVRERGLSGMDDLRVLEYASQNALIVITHDVNTMVGFAYDRLNSGERMPGLIVIPVSAPISVVIEEVSLIAQAVSESEIDGQILFVPM